MKQKIVACLLAVSLCIPLSGCSIVGFDAQSLMHTPRPTGDKAGIHAELEKQAGAGFTLRYPARGDYRYAIITRESTGNGMDEAVAFYQKKGENAGTNVMFMEKREDGWKSTGVFSNAANAVDQVLFGDVNKDGKDETVIGWGSAKNSTTAIGVYYNKNGTVSETKLEQSYTEMALGDYDNDSAAELFTANIAVGDQPAMARLMRLKESGAEIMGTAALDSGVTQYTSFLSGFINEQQKGVVLDGAKSANMLVTELLYWDSAAKVLKSPFYDPATQSDNITKRSTQALSKDINGDKIIEVPIVTLLPGYMPDSAQDETNYLTNWYRYDTVNTTMTCAQRVIMNYTDGYWLLIPDTRRGKVTAQMDRVTRTLTLYEWIPNGTAGEGSLGSALLSVRMFPSRSWDAERFPTFKKIMENNNLIYAAEFLAPDNPLSLSENDVKDALRIINQE